MTSMTNSTGIPGRIPLDEAARRDTNQMYYELALAIEFSWRQRDYQDTSMGMQIKNQHNSFTEINTRRRAERLRVLKSLISFYEGRKFYSEKQREMISRMAKNAKIKKSEVAAIMAKRKQDDEQQRRDAGAVGEMNFEIPSGSGNSVPKAPTVAAGETGHASDAERAESAKRMLTALADCDDWPDNIGDRDFQFCNSLLEKDAKWGLDRVSVPQWRWLKDIYDHHVCGLPRRRANRDD